MENKDKLKLKINEFIDMVVDEVFDDGNINYFDIEISNHAGDVNMKYTKKKKEKAY